ncbi:MAG: ferrous iron transport protein B [Bacteroidaceae bacterium]|jgi:ferrous iron transport protein B|nr:ferrous iron transport protein B [Bacteroidaceae bacterium]
MTLADLKTGQTATISSVGGNGSLRQHFLDMGVLPGVPVTLVKFAPMGDPMELRIHDYELTLRRDDARKIEIGKILHSPISKQEQDIASSPEPQHPGLGEGGHYHEEQEKAEGRDLNNPRPEKDRRLTFALVGNQNTGKTTLFNQLTGFNQHVGNFPGVTVDRKDGAIKGYPNTMVTDLPGIYSLSPYTNEEIVSRKFILEENPSAIINIIDATCIERNLYLTMQLMELGKPMVLALNMMDEIKNNHGSIRINELEQLLGIPVVPISAMRNEGVDEVVRHAIHVARYQEGPLRHDYCSPQENGGAVHRCFHAIMHLIEDHAQRAKLPIRFAAAKLIEGDSLVMEALALSQNEHDTVEHILCQMEEERGLDRQAAIASMRFDFIRSICHRTVVRPRETKEYVRSQWIDKLLTGRWTALPSFVIIMALVFWLTFDGIGAWLQEQVELGVEWIVEITESFLTSIDIAPAIHSLIIDGIYGGIGSVIVFLPLILILFFSLSLMEDSGYMARIAFVMDRPLRKLGLSGRSIVPLLLGFGCSVPSVMSSRTLPSVRDRRLTIMLTPFMSCTAKIPIYAFFAATFFPENAALVMLSLYFLGITIGIIVALAMKHTWFRGEAVPFVMELPNYRLPVPQNVFRLLWDKANDFLRRAFTVIFLASIVIWFMQTFTFQLQMVEPGMEDESMLAKIAGVVVPLFSPLGLGDWRIVTSLVSGMLAKEVVVSTLNTLFAGVSISEIFNATTAYAMMAFCLLYTPCIAAMATIRRELGNIWAIIVLFSQCAIAWLVAFIITQIL